MKHLLLALILSPLALAAAVETDDAFEEECELNRFYAGAAGTAFLIEYLGDAAHNHIRQLRNRTGNLNKMTPLLQITERLAARR